MTSLAERYELVDHVTSKVPGWLLRGAGTQTLEMLEWQDRTGVKGSFLEIGVYSGLYFSLLLHHARQCNAYVVGVDPFVWKTLDDASTAIRGAVGDYERAKLITAYSSDCDTGFLLDHMKEKARFISVDGSHERDDVYWDLGLAESLLASGGIIAVDDFMNPMTMGVTEAVHRFFSVPRRVTPWAYIQNKLFLSQAMYSREYKLLLESSLQSDTVGEHAARFRKNDRGLTEGKLWGYPILQVT